MAPRDGRASRGSEAQCPSLAAPWLPALSSHSELHTRCEILPHIQGTSLEHTHLPKHANQQVEHEVSYESKSHPAAGNYTN